MHFDKTILKRQIDQSRANEILVLTVNKLEKDSISTNLKRIDKFINSRDDYVITVMKR
jgi:predicted XRE-type DNA-binding protein